MGIVRRCLVRQVGGPGLLGVGPLKVLRNTPFGGGLLVVGGEAMAVGHSLRVVVLSQTVVTKSRASLASSQFVLRWAASVFFSMSSRPPFAK